MFLISGLLVLLMKGSRFIYILLSLEMFMLGMLISNSSLFSELNFTLVLLFSVSSSVIGLVVLVTSISQYGSENVKF